MNRFVLLLLAALLRAHAVSAAPIYPGTFFSRSDSIPPAVNCPPDDTVQLNPGVCTAFYTYLVVAYDDLPGFVLEQTGGIPPDAVYPIGTTINTWLVTDSGGNTDACSFRVVVRNFPATLQCTDEIAFHLYTPCAGTPTAALLLEGGPYGCLDSFVVQIDRTPPYGNGPWLPAMLDAADIDQAVWYRVRDPFTGNSCTGIVYAKDTVRPVIICTPLAVPCVVDSFSIAYLMDSLGLNGVIPTVSDNCTPPPTFNFTDVFQNFPCNDTSTISGQVRRTWRAEDGRGYTATCVQNIALQRLLSDVELPPDITLGCEDDSPPPSVSGEPFIRIGNRRVSLFDDTACEFDALYQDSVVFLCGGSRRLLREWQIFDACLPLSADNPKTGIQIIQLVDTLGPGIDCPPNLTVQSPAFTCSGAVLLPDMVILDDCSPISGYAVQWEAGDSTYSMNGMLVDFPGNDPLMKDTLGRLDSLPVVDVGKTVLLFSATDACGNTGQCSTILTLWDMAAPAAVCDTLLSVTLSQEGIAALAAVEMDAGSLDACGSLVFRAFRPGSPCAPDSLWRDSVYFCCADWGDTVEVTLRVYDIELPEGPLNTGFGAGQFGDCTVQVLVQADSTLKCTAPRDTVVDCLSFDPTLASYGQPLLSCSVDSIAVHVAQSGFDNACRSGVLLRRFTVFNTAGDSTQCEQQITSAHLQRFFIRFPDDVIATVCNPAGEYGEPAYFEEYCGQISVTFTDQVFDVVPDACYKIERIWTVVNTCSNTPGSTLVDIINPNPLAVSNHPSNLPGPIVSPVTAAGDPWQATVVAITPGEPPTDYSTFWQADAVGYRYIQTIKIIDQVAPVAVACPPNEVLFSDTLANIPTFWNDDFVPSVGKVDICESVANIRVEFTEDCSAVDLSVKYFLHLDLDGDGVQETVVRSDQPSLNGLIAINNANNPQFMGGDIRTFDNRQVPNDQKYRFWLRKTVNGTVHTAQVIWNTPANPSSYVAPKLPVGVHAITWIANDRCGNEKSCYYQFTVEKADGACTELVGAVSGTLETETGSGVQFAQVRLVADSPNLPPIDMTVESGQDGQYNHTPVLAAGASYEITPERKDTPNNGVTTFDLVFISRHILGQDTLNSPYQIIAADANRSNSVTSFDIVELRRLILGIHDTLPNAPSWRFVDKNYVFPNPLNPFQEPFPEKVMVANLEPAGSTIHDFIGLKVGDLNSSAVSNAFPQPDDRNRPDLPFYLEDRLVQAGEIVEIELSVPEALPACQFTLECPGIEIINLIPGNAMDDEQFGVFPDRRALTVAWHTGGEGALPSFVLRGKAQKTARLSDLLTISGRITAAEAYTSAGAVKKPALMFRGTAVPQNARHWYLPEPNPFRDVCRLRCFVPQEETVQLRVFDAAGREVLVQEKYLPAGEQVILLDFSEVNASGVLQVVVQSSENINSLIIVRKQ
jgi:hypothetical protein